VVEWLSYADAMRQADAVVCHAGHGTLARALASGAPVIACPVAGDMAENGARVAWAGAGVSLPRRLIGPRGVRLAVRKVLAGPSFAGGADTLRAGARTRGGAAAPPDAVEELARG
jgi:UDP:flavonoid glycosyltransferase YjiC (YdhE family)